MVICPILSWEISVLTTSITLIPGVLNYYYTAVHQLCIPRLNSTSETNPLTRSCSQEIQYDSSLRLIIELSETPKAIVLCMCRSAHIFMELLCIFFAYLKTEVKHFITKCPGLFKCTKPASQWKQTEKMGKGMRTTCNKCSPAGFDFKDQKKKN